MGMYLFNPPSILSLMLLLLHIANVTEPMLSFLFLVFQLHDNVLEK